jgi:hypothetical protein
VSCVSALDAVVREEEAHFEAEAVPARWERQAEESRALLAGGSAPLSHSYHSLPHIACSCRAPLSMQTHRSHCSTLLQ